MNKQLRRVLACLALCAVLAGSLPVPAAAAGFQDIPSTHWAAESIQRCVEQGFFQGQTATRFGLGEPMTRSAFTVVLCRFFGWEVSAPAQSVFRDVPADAWYAGAVEAAYAHGALTNQRQDFRPGDAITREELAVMLVRALGYDTIAGLSQELPMPFRDVITNAGYISMAYALGLVNGTSAEYFSPDQTAPREQVAVILMRLYDKLHGEGPALTAVVSAPADLTGLDAAAIPAARVSLLSGEVTVTALMEQETVDAILESARAAGAQALLHVTGGITVLNADPAETAEALKETVVSGGWDGLFLDIPRQNEKKTKTLTKLAATLDAELGDLPLYLAAEAPVWNGTSYGGYDHKALAAVADHLVLRIAPYKEINGTFTAAPVDPLEEIYYTLFSLRKTTDTGKLSLMLTTAPSVWSRDQQQALSAEELASLMADGDAHYSDRYACAYFMGEGSEGQALVAWYLNHQAAEARLQLARLFGAGQLCLSDWNAASEDLLAGLRQ